MVRATQSGESGRTNFAYALAVTLYVPNLRDIGGLPADEGAEVRRGRVLRSAMPLADDLVGPEFSWPPEVVIDLRSAGETEPVHPLSLSGSRILNFPLLSALQPGLKPVRSLVELYQVMIDSAAGMLVEIVREVSSCAGPSLIHCAAGKDRTGVSIALLLRLVGVDREHVVADFMASEAARSEIAARLAHLPNRGTMPPIPPAFLAVPSEAIEAVLDFWDAQDGGVEGWLVAAGAEDALASELRNTLLL